MLQRDENTIYVFVDAINIRRTNVTKYLCDCDFVQYFSIH